MKQGRPQKHFHPAWSKEPIIGLWHQPDGRWRVIESGHRFSETDERRAVQRFCAMTGRAAPIADIPVDDINVDDLRDGTNPQYDLYPDDDPAPMSKLAKAVQNVSFDAREIGYRASIPESSVWAWVRQQIVDRPDHASRQLGIDLRYADVPSPSLKLETLIVNYQTHNPSQPRSKQGAIKVFRTLTKHCQATTLDDLTTKKLLAWKAEIEKTIPGPGSRKAYYTRVKTVIAFGLKTGLDAAQIQAAIGRMKVLWTSDPMPNVDPKPISRADFHSLLGAATGIWRAWLLCGLNLCLHMEEVCGLLWTDFDLEAGTYCAIRAKTRRKRIPRAACLWPETIAVLNILPRKGPYVFPSTHGIRYTSSARVNNFRHLRAAAGLPNSITFDMLRDGAYTAACNGTTDARLAKILAGHSAGMADNYVLRNPAIVKPACDSVYRTYGPFPIKGAS